MQGTLNDEFRTLTKDGVVVKFAHKEYRVIKRLWLQGIVRRQQMLKVVYPHPDELDNTYFAINHIVMRVRKKIKPLGLRIVTTQRGWEIQEIE